MKKIIPLITLLTLSTAMFSQPFLGIGVTNKGANFQVGGWIKDMELSIAYKLPLINNDVAKIASFSAGLKLGKYIIPSIGVASYRVKDFTKYNNDPSGQAPIEQISEIHPVYQLEAGINKYHGRIFAQVSYCKTAYFGIGIKMFTSRID